MKRDKDSQPPPPAGEATDKTRKGWRTGLLILGSAVVGGGAVALWHRRTLRQFQAAADAPPVVQAAPAEEEIY